MKPSAFFSAIHKTNLFMFLLSYRGRRGLWLCAESVFLPVVLELSGGVFNNSVLAVPGDLPGRQCEAAREDTYSFSQSEWGRRRMCGELLPISATRWSPIVLLLSTSVSCFCCLIYLIRTVTVFPSVWHLFIHSVCLASF